MGLMTVGRGLTRFGRWSATDDSSPPNPPAKPPGPAPGGFLFARAALVAGFFMPGRSRHAHH
jgi:hypothetical protein